MTRMAADSPTWLSSLKLGMNLVASQGLTSVFWHFWSTPRAARQPLRLRACCAKLATLSDHIEHSSRGDLQLLYPAVSSKLPVMSFACRNFPRSAIQAQEEVLDPCCEPYAQSSPSLAFFTGSKKAWDWMSNGSLQSYSLACFLLPWRAVSHHSLLCRRA